MVVFDALPLCSIERLAACTGDDVDADDALEGAAVCTAPRWRVDRPENIADSSWSIVLYSTMWHSACAGLLGLGDVSVGTSGVTTRDVESKGGSDSADVDVDCVKASREEVSPKLTLMFAVFGKLSCWLSCRLFLLMHKTRNYRFV